MLIPSGLYVDFHWIDYHSLTYLLFLQLYHLTEPTRWPRPTMTWMLFYSYYRRQVWFNVNLIPWKNNTVFHVWSSSGQSVWVSVSISCQTKPFFTKEDANQRKKGCLFYAEIFVLTFMWNVMWLCCIYLADAMKFICCWNQRKKHWHSST